MPTVTQQNNTLTLTLDATEINCQVIDLSFSPVGRSAGTPVEVACGPGAVVTEPGSPANGSLTGNVFADSTATGVTRLLAEAQATNAVIAYALTFWSDIAGSEMEWSGNARVNTLTVDWAKPGYGKHPIDLAVETSTLAPIVP